MKARDAFRADKAGGYICGLCRSPGHNRRTCPRNHDKSPPRVTESRSQQAARLVAGAGITVSEAARKFGITRQAVDQILQRFRGSNNYDYQRGLKDAKPGPASLDASLIRIVHDVLDESARLSGADADALTAEIARRFQLVRR